MLPEMHLVTNFQTRCGLIQNFMNMLNSVPFTYCKILKSSTQPVILEKLKLDEAYDCKVRKHYLLEWWRILTPAVLKICHK